MKANKDELWWSMRKIAQDMIVIDHDPTPCGAKRSFFKVCHYSFFAVGNDKHEISKYDIKAVRSGSQILLREGKA